MTQVVLAWSGGKDAAYALVTLQSDPTFEVVELLTTFDEGHDRSSMHGVRRSLHQRQAEALDLPLRSVMLPHEATNEEYNRVMQSEFERYTDRGIDRIVYADLFLEDIRAYREQQLAETGLAGYWPLWGTDTDALVEELLSVGIRATLVAVDGDVLDRSFAGRDLSPALLADLPTSVDPCGENGEFHTFVWDGPTFSKPVSFDVGETVTRAVGDTELHYADLVEEE